MDKLCWAVGLVSTLLSYAEASSINRQQVVRKFNPQRNASSPTTPLQVGNGNFAFGVDVTGLQTFSPFASLSSWGWHNFSLPTTPNQTSISDFTGMDWFTHGRLVNYNIQNPAEADISNWLVENPQRINLGTIGFWFADSTVTEDSLTNKFQTLDLWSGQLSSSFTHNGTAIKTTTWAHPDSSIIALNIESDLLSSEDIGIFFDYPLPDINKFDAPFVGVFSQPENHTTLLRANENSASIKHTLDTTTYYTLITWEGNGQIVGPLNGTHRYILKFPKGPRAVQLTCSFSPSSTMSRQTYSDTATASTNWWESYWESGAFVDLTASQSSDAMELQRRIIQSQYLLAVNEAATYDSPQESGLVNIGWYGKFHLEMALWHLLHWARWNRFPLLWRSIPTMYDNFLSSSFDRARDQGYIGARWGKMSDPTGRSAPGDINNLLIWQQPHPMHFAEIEYRSFPNETTLQRWDEIITASADFMASYAWYNESTGVYDLGPPLYPVPENTNPNITINPTFELAYWRFGLDIAITWKQRQNLEVPVDWTIVRNNLAPLPVVDDAFAVYEGIPNMWENNTSVQDHPSMTGIYGLLPPPQSGTPLNMTIVKNTAKQVLDLWDFDNLYGWDFPLLAMNSLRLGDVNQAVEYLLHPLFPFDDAGYPESTRVPTPYFPASSSFLLAVAMMAGGWDGSVGTHFPEGWIVQVEGFVAGL